jgi:two-component system, chemotaxis family, protein-glutamate methylesterase/glutaminase
MNDESVQCRDLVVIGASAGGLEVLRRVVSELPVDLNASVCVVLHIAPGSPSALAPILDRAGPLPCRAAADGDPLRSGQILVAPPDRHVVVEDGRVRLTPGPRENGHRPAVNPLFRSAARARGRRVIGVVLSGTQDDGAAGLAVIKACGGGTIVQDPMEAMYAGMPANAIAHVAVDAVAPLSLIAGTIASMVNGGALPVGTNPDGDPFPVPVPFPSPDPVGEESNTTAVGEESNTTVCTDCGRVAGEQTEGRVTRCRCGVEDSHGDEVLADPPAERVEGVLWAAVHAIEDRQALLEQMASQAEERGQSGAASAFRARGNTARDNARQVREALERAVSTTVRGLGDPAARHHEETAA